MESTNARLGIIVILLLFIGIVSICTHRTPPEKTSTYLSEDTAFVSQWKKEKQELQKQYDQQISAMQLKHDSLQSVANEKKEALATYRLKAEDLQNKLKEVLVQSDSTHQFSDSTMPLANAYFNAETQEDSTCNETIHSLEQLVGNRDSTIVIYKRAEINLRDVQKEQELRTHYLTEQLNTAYKVQKKKSRQSKFLAGSLVFLSGLATTLLITQTLK
jgi:hypothetical protein